MSAAPHASTPGDARPPLPLLERQRLRSIGTIAGALVGVGVAVLIPGLLFGIVVAASATGGSGGNGAGGDPGVWWVALPVVGGALLVVAGWIVSLRRLRHWGSGLVVPVASALGIAAGALVGSGAWPWMGHVLRPQALPTGERPLAQG